MGLFSWLAGRGAARTDAVPPRDTDDTASSPESLPSGAWAYGLEAARRGGEQVKFRLSGRRTQPVRV